MTPLSEIKCLVYDYGNYFQVAERLGRIDGFGKVYYFCPKVYNGFPDHKPMDIGRNVPNVEVVKEWASVIDEVDIVVHCDSHEPGLQNYFQSIGKKVFGSRFACELENDRLMLKQTLKEIGLPVNEYEIANGMDELEVILKQKENVYVKSSLRGDMETWHHENYLLSRGELLRMRNDLGAYYNQETYIIEQPIDSFGEIGLDSFCCDGIFPPETMAGIEIKDTMYFAKIVPYHSLPRQLRNVTDKFYSIFSDLGYRGAFSDEVRMSKDKQGFLIDPCCRFPQPPTDLSLEMYENYPQIIWDVANGITPQLKYTYPIGVQFIIKSELGKENPSPLIVPDEYKRFVKVKNLVIDDDGTWYYTPMGVPMSEIGSVSGFGTNIYEAAENAKKVFDNIKGFDISINSDAVDEVIEQLNTLKINGINYL